MSRFVSFRLVSSRLQRFCLTSLGGFLLVFSSCDAPELEDAPSEVITFRTDPLPDAACEPGSDCEGDVPYLHPFQNVELVDGQIPLLDLKDSPAGKRYMLISSASQPADGAPIERFSGIIEVERRTLEPHEIQEIPAAPVLPVPKVGPTLADAVEDALDAGEGAAPVRFLLAAERPPSETITHQLDRAIALGEIQTYADRRAVRSTLVQQRMLAIEQDMDPVVDSITALGATVLDRCAMAHCLYVEAPFDLVATIADAPGVARLDRSTDPSLDGHDPSYEEYLDGNWIREIHQFEQFWAAGHDGSNGSNPSIVVAMFDNTPPLTTHLGFRDYGFPNPPWYRLGPSRVLGNFVCDGGTHICSDQSYSQPNPGADHGTAVAGIVFGDLTDGQFASITNPTERARRSGYAPESKAWVYTASGSLNDALYQTVWDHAAGQDPQPAVFFQSVSHDVDFQCLGEEAVSRQANESLYEAGVFHVNSPGNHFDPGSNTDCKVSSPGPAIGTFTVGAHAGEGAVSDFCQARGASLASFSPWGGSPTVYSEGKLRSIIDLTAYAPQEYRFQPDGGTGGFFSGTSAAAPTVAAAAVDLIDVFHTTFWSSAIDDPGVLFVNMLMQGDRQGGQGLLDAGFDHRWGAGRMRLRMVSDAGMDAPAWYATGWTCVDHLEVVTWDSSTLAGPVGTSIPTGADAFKAVIWWYDRRHETGQTVAKLKLVLRKTNGNVIRTSESFDNKQMVYHGNPSQIGSLEIVGQSVSSDLEGCGNNSMKVFVAWAFEDSARDDADGPTWNAPTCEGVEPW